MLRFSIPHKIAWAVLFAFTFLMFTAIESAYAYSTLYLSPSKKSFFVGATQEVELRLNTDSEEVNAFSAYLSYPADKLDVTLVSYSEQFPIVAEGEIGNGSIRISQGSITPVVGDVPIATFMLKGKLAGTVPIEFVSGSAVARYTDSTDALSLSRSVGGFYTIEKAAAVTARRRSILFRFFSW